MTEADILAAARVLFLTDPERHAAALGLSLGGTLYRSTGHKTGTYVRAFYITPEREVAP